MTSLMLRLLIPILYILVAIKMIHSSFSLAVIKNATIVKLFSQLKNAK